VALRPDEEFCAAMLGAWFTWAGRSHSWVRGEDPPDLAFEIDGERWGIEVTGLHRYFLDIDNSVQPAASVYGPLRKMEERLTLLAARKGRPATGYSAMIEGPLGALTPKKLESILADYIRSGSTDGMVIRQSKPHVVIAGFNLRSDLPSRFGMSLFLSGYSIGGKRDSVLGDIRSNVEYAIDRTLENKLPSMTNIGSYERSALCLYAVDALVEAELVQDVLSAKILAASRLDAIVFIDRENRIEAVFDPMRRLPGKWSLASEV